MIETQAIEGEALPLPPNNLPSLKSIIGKGIDYLRSMEISL
jgi:hypothetical protein